MSQLALHLFGTPRLEMDDAPVHIPRRKAMALLAYLANTGQNHSRDALATLLWPENDQSGARAELRRTLSVLKRALGNGWWVADRETAGLDLGNLQSGDQIFWLDVLDFKAKLAVGEGHNHSPTDACPECTPDLKAAVELYSADFMAGFSLKDCREYDEWQFFQSEELRSQLANALAKLTRYYESSQDYDSAIGYTRRRLALDTMQEAAHRQLMSLFWQSGQRSAALRQYEQCKQGLADELGVEPSEDTWELYQKIQTSGLLSAAASRPNSNLPVQTTPFIGRETELADIRAKLKGEDCRLLTLLGPGGSGKTWLAVEAARGLLDDFKHGIFFVNLAPLEDTDRIPSTIAAALSFSFHEEGTPEEQLLDYLGNKELLLILDNFEHILAGINLVNNILNEASGLKILATSRISLNVSNENIFDVWGMTYPESPAVVKTTIDQYSAVKLFDTAAKRRQASFRLSNESIPDLIRICALVEGMPLGIVLAASWAKMLNPKEIAVEITRDLSFLEKELQDLPERQRGMRSVFNHSWRLLSEREQRILCALSVFRGGFTREAAQIVANASLGDLMGLIDKSMLHLGADRRFEIHEMLRQYAVEKLGSDPAIEDHIRGQHSDYYCQALAVWERELQGPKQVAANQKMTAELGNIRIAWDWAVEKIRVKQLFVAINGLCMFFHRNYQFFEGATTCQALNKKLVAMSAADKTWSGSHDDCKDKALWLRLQARALSWGGHFHLYLGNRQNAAQLTHECLSLLENSILIEHDTRFDKAFAFITLPWALENAQPSEKHKMAEEVVTLFIAINEPWWVSLALRQLGFLTTSKDEPILIIEEALAVSRKQGDLRGIVNLLSILSSATALQWEFEKAEKFLAEGLEINQKLDDRHAIFETYADMGSQLVWQGRFREARSVEQEILATYPDLEYAHNWVVLHAIAGFPDQYLGAYEAARSQAIFALQLIKKVKYRQAAKWEAINIEILGRIALAEGSYAEAENWFQKCMLIYYNYDDSNNIGQALACLGFTARGLGQISQTQRHLAEALRVAIEAESYLSLFHILPGIALMFADKGEIERAVELYALASTQGIVANSKWFDDIAGDEIAAAAKQLPVEVADAAKASGRGLDLWETAAELLV